MTPNVLDLFDHQSNLWWWSNRSKTSRLTILTAFHLKVLYFTFSISLMQCGGKFKVDLNSFDKPFKLINHASMGRAQFMFYSRFFFFLSATRCRPPLGQLWIMQSVMFTRQTLFLQGQQKSQITKSRRTHALQKSLFKTLTSKQYITLVLIATSYQQ